MTCRQAGEAGGHQYMTNLAYMTFNWIGAAELGGVALLRRAMEGEGLVVDQLER